MNDNYCSGLFGELGRRFQIEGVTGHTLRHTFASRLSRQEVTLAVVRDLPGHTTFKMITCYLCVEMKTMADAVNVQPGFGQRLSRRGLHPKRPAQSIRENPCII